MPGRRRGRREARGIIRLPVAQRDVPDALPAASKPGLLAAFRELVCTPATYLMVASAVVTVAAKATVIRDLDGGVALAVLAWVTAPDVATFAVLAALLALAASRGGFLRMLATCGSAAVAFFALLNAGYLYVAGEQLTWEAVLLGTDRWADVRPIISVFLLEGGWPMVALVLAVVYVPPAILGRVARRPVQGAPGATPEVIRVAVLAALAAGLARVAAPGPTFPVLQRLGANALVKTVWTMLAAREVGSQFVGYHPERVVSEEAVAAFAQGPRPNVVVFVMESARFDHTSLAGSDAKAATPHLQALAERGLTAARARAVVPLTTKSLFTILTGRYPLMQAAVIEPSGPFRAQGLAGIVKGAGYLTGFLQSARCDYEDREELVKRLGFDVFACRERLETAPLGYLASDDESLVNPAKAFFAHAEKAGKPFILGVLTSATHHPYVMSDAARLQAEELGRATALPEDRYARLIERQDVLLGEMVADLGRRGMLESTIVIAMGDHGEGLGAKGIRFHDSNYFDEGLRTPLVFAGPGFPHRRIEQEVSMLDVMPTMLAALGIPPAADADLQGRNLLADVIPDVPLLFSCWLPNRGRGFVHDGRKVVEILDGGQVFEFDLRADPGEEHPLPVSPELQRKLAVMRAVFSAYQDRDYGLGGVRRAQRFSYRDMLPSDPR